MVIYDLSVSPCSYDFFQFLVSAELHRKRYGFASIQLIFLPGPKNGYRQDSIRTDEQNEMFFKNVILPGTSVLPSITSVLQYDNRSDFILPQRPLHAIYPRGFKVIAPVADYVLSGVAAGFFRGEGVAIFEAPGYAKDIASKMLAKIGGDKKIVTLTTRELARDDSGTRTIQKEVWRDFFATIDRNIFQPVIIRDTATAFTSDPFFNDIPEINAASIHLPLRLAKYEESYLNYFKNNGPAVFGYYSRANAIIFNEFDDKHIALSADWHKNNYGMNRGSQNPLPLQNIKIVYGVETVDVLKEALAGRIAKLNCEITDVNPFKDADNMVLTLLTSLNYMVQNLKFGVLPEDAFTVKIAQQVIKNHNLDWDLESFITELESKGWPKNLWGQIVELGKKIQ
jgi:hypothetical protein